MERMAGNEDVPLIVIICVSILGTLLLLLNVLMVVFYIHKRKQKEQKTISPGTSEEGNYLVFSLISLLFFLSSHCSPLPRGVQVQIQTCDGYEHVTATEASYFFGCLDLLCVLDRKMAKN